MGTRWPETCWATYKGEINIILKVTSSWSLYPHWTTMHGQPYIKILLYSLNTAVHACKTKRGILQILRRQPDRIYSVNVQFGSNSFGSDWHSNINWNWKFTVVDYYRLVMPSYVPAIFVWFLHKRRTDNTISCLNLRDRDSNILGSSSAVDENSISSGVWCHVDFKRVTGVSEASPASIFTVYALQRSSDYLHNLGLEKFFNSTVSAFWKSTLQLRFWSVISLVGLLSGGLSRSSVHWFFGWLVDSLFVWFLGFSLVGLFVGFVVVWFVRQFLGSLVGWLTHCLVPWLFVGRFVRWLVDRLACSFVLSFVHSFPSPLGRWLVSHFFRRNNLFLDF